MSLTPEELDAENVRLHDLVRRQRGPLHDAGLLTDEEYAALAADHGAVARLETIDGLRASLATATRERDEARDDADMAEKALERIAQAAACETCRELDRRLWEEASADLPWPACSTSAPTGDHR